MLCSIKVNANSGGKVQQPWWNVSDVQDFHGFPPTTIIPTGATNASLLVANSEALKCGCLPPAQHMWFHDLAAQGKAPCYSSGGVSDDCEVASAKFGPWEAAAADAKLKPLGEATNATANRQHADARI